MYILTLAWERTHLCELSSGIYASRLNFPIAQVCLWHRTWGRNQNLVGQTEPEEKALIC